MIRSRLMVVLGLAIVGTGLLAAFGMRFASVRAAVGPLPAQALDLPAEVHFILDLDLRRFVGSPFYQKFGQKGSPNRLQALDEMQRSAGIDPERDLDRLIVGSLGSARKENVVLAFGRFDLPQLEQKLAAKATRTVVGKTTLYRLSDTSQPPSAVAILDPGCLLVGSAGLVEEVVAKRGEAALRGNARLLSLIEGIGPATTFWMASDDSALAGLDSSAGGAGRLPLGLPPLKSVVVTADFEPAVTLALTAETQDEKAAVNLADMVKGLMAMAAVQAQQKPELAQISQAVNVAAEGPRVSVTCHASYALLEALAPKRATEAKPTPTPDLAPAPAAVPAPRQ